MRRLARTMLALQVAGVVVLVATQMAALAQPSPAPSSSPSSPAASASPSSAEPSPPASSASPSGPPSPSSVELSSPEPHASSPSPSPSSSDSETPRGELSITTASTEVIAQVGELVHYRAQVSNGAGAPLDRVFVVAFLPPEVTFVSADLLPEVEATLYNRIGAEESITWNVGEIGPGDEVTLTWAVRVVSPGDMTAVNAVRAVADGAPRVRRESATYLATATNVGGPNPSPSPSTTRVVSYERVPAGSAQGATAGEPGVVPETGFSGELVVSAAALLVGAGALLWWIGAPGPRRRRRVALAAAAMALLAACTSSGDLDHATPRQTGSPQVKGRRIGPDGQTRDLGEDRGGPSENGDRTSGRGGRDDGSADEPVGGGDVPTPTEPAPAPGGFTFVRTVDVLPVDPFLEPVAKLASRDADETVTYTWSGAGIAGIQSSTSAYGSPVEVGTVLRERGPALEATVRVTNASADTPVLVDGTLGLRIDGSAEAVLTAAPARSTLMPGGSTSASFTFDLPAGSYSSTGFFAAS